MLFASVPEAIENYLHYITRFSGADPGFDRGAPDRDWPKTAILGPQFCRILVLGTHFWWSGEGPGATPGSAPDFALILVNLSLTSKNVPMR